MFVSLCCKYVLYACICVYVHVMCIAVCIYICKYVCMYVCLYACMLAYTYVCQGERVSLVTIISSVVIYCVTILSPSDMLSKLLSYQ